jgi:outer membrane protein assembly factor BamD
MISKFTMSFIRFLIISTALTFVSACSSLDVDPTTEWTAEDFYDEAKAALNAGEFQTAIKNLETLEARFPFDPYAKQAQLDIAYSYYKFDEPETAISSIQRFIRLHPRDPHIDYALYLKALINFNRGKGILESWFPHDPAKHDPSILRNAFNDFAMLIKRFPDSHYAGDSHQRMVYLRNKMAEQEIDNAEYYIKRKTWLGAANRAKVVIEKYPQSVWRNRALEIMIQAYEEMGLKDLALDTKRVLEMNRKTAPQQDAAVDRNNFDIDVMDATLAQPPSLI